MRLTTKGRYAVTAMLDLALHQGQRPVTLQDIAMNQEISLSYLEQLFARLRRAGWFEAPAGRGVVTAWRKTRVKFLLPESLPRWTRKPT